MKNSIKGIRTSFGLIGILTAMYWALLHAKFGLIGKVCGQEALDWANTKMSLFSDILPYIVFFVAFICGCLWLGYSIYEWVSKRKRKSLSKDEVKDKINELLDQLK